MSWTSIHCVDQNERRKEPVEGDTGRDDSERSNISFSTTLTRTLICSNW